MDLIRGVIQNPVKVAVGVLLVCMFGLLSIFLVPVQLTPDIDRPMITVQTFWEGASPQEIEREIVDRQEEKLKGVRGLKKMTSISRDNDAEVTLEFYVGTDKDTAIRDVSEKLRQVTGYPIEVDEPVIVTSGADMSATIAWLIFRGAPGEDVSGLKDYVEDHVKPLLERADGIAGVDVYGGREREVKVIVDAYKLASRGLPFTEVADALRRQNDNISAGTTSLGKREYSYRTIGQYERVEDVEDTVIAYRNGGPVLVRDVATVENTFKKQYSFVKSTGDFVLALPARRETGANVISTMEALKEQIALVNKEVLQPVGRSLELTQVYDETVYINAAIDMVLDNIYVGGLLTVIVLLLFLRNLPATGIVTLSIPITVIATFLAIWLSGRNLNVIMLAGLAFAIGMGIDNSIVVMENIFRHRQLGKPALEAAQKGTAEVWLAIFGGTLVNLAVFLPVLFIEEEAGQLFRDLALAISFCVGISLIVSGTVIPVLCARILHVSDVFGERDRGILHAFSTGLSRLVYRINGSRLARVTVLVVLTTASIGLSWWLTPDADYLPTGNRNLVFGFVVMPPGYSVEQVKQLALAVEEGNPKDANDGMRALWEAQRGSAEEKTLPATHMRVGVGESAHMVEVPTPPIENFFFVAFGGGAFMGSTSKYDNVVKPLVSTMTESVNRVPGLAGFFSQVSLIADLGGGNNVDIEIRGEQLSEVVQVAKALQPRIMKDFGFPLPTPNNFDLGRPEVRVVPDREKAADLGLNVRDVGFIVQAAVDGALVGSFRNRGDDIDLKLHVAGVDDVSPGIIEQVPVATPSGRVVPLGSAVQFVTDSAPQQINHIEEMPAVTLTVQTPEGVALQTLLRRLDTEIINPMRESGQIPSTVITSLSGTADKLVQTRQALFGSWVGGSLQPDRHTGKRPLVESLINILTSRGIIALLITYLLMAAVFESFTWPFVIMFTVPLATVGGFTALWLVHYFTVNDPVSPVQQLDVLTMLGFIILAGVVVNNGILLVHQAINYHQDEGMPWREAISESVRTRVRPILMTAFGSVAGGLPLVVKPGSGSELYRGLGAVMLGGLVVSTLFTLILIPTTMSLFIEVREWVFSRARAVWVPRRQRSALPATGSVANAPNPGASGQAAAGTLRSPGH